MTKKVEGGSMPRTGMILGMIKRLEKRISAVEEQIREQNIRHPEGEEKEVQVRVREDTVSDLGSLHT